MTVVTKDIDTCNKHGTLGEHFQIVDFGFLQAYLGIIFA